MFKATPRSKRSRTPRTDELSRTSNKSGLQVSLCVNTGCRLINAFSQNVASIPTFDPIIVEDTALDRAVEGGFIQLNGRTIPAQCDDDVRVSAELVLDAVPLFENNVKDGLGKHAPLTPHAC